MRRASRWMGVEVVGVPGKCAYNYFKVRIDSKLGVKMYSYSIAYLMNKVIRHNYSVSIFRIINS